MKKFFVLFFVLFNYYAVFSQQYRFEVKTDDLTKSYPIDSLSGIVFHNVDTSYHIRVEYMDSTKSDSINIFDYNLNGIMGINFLSVLPNNTLMSITSSLGLNLLTVDLYNLVKLEIYKKDITAPDTANGVEEIKYQLKPTKNYPNPFVDETQIEFTVETPSNCSAVIVNMSGELIKSIDLGNLTEGKQTFTWNGIDGQGNLAPKGFYICKIISGSDLLIQKIIKY